jgi:aspartokinase
MANITKLTEQYINNHPSIKDSLKKGLINYSALTRLICKDMRLSKSSFDAVLIAARRYRNKIKGEKIQEDKIVDLLSKGKLEVKNKVIVGLVEKARFNNLAELHKLIKDRDEIFHVIEGSNTITIITAAEFISEIKRLFKNKVIKITENLAEVTLKTSDDMEQIPGVVAYLTSLLSERGINIIETMSTYTDTLFVVDEKDISKVMEVLRF